MWVVTAAMRIDVAALIAAVCAVTAAMRANVAAFLAAVRYVAARMRIDVGALIAAVRTVTAAMRANVAAFLAAVRYVGAGTDESRRPLAVVVRRTDHRSVAGGRWWGRLVEVEAAVRPNSYGSSLSRRESSGRYTARYEESVS